MTKLGSAQYRLALLSWLATVATSLAFLPALSQQRCILIGALLAAAAVGVGVLLRLVRTPAILVLVAQLFTICEILLVSYGRHLAYGVIPTKATFRALTDTLDVGMQVARDYAAPAPASLGLLLMVVFFIAAMAAVADFLTVGLGRVPLAGLPLLALYTVPVAALADGVPFYGFLPGAACYVALLMADERDRLAHWGRLVTRVGLTKPSRAAMDTSGLTAAGRKISLLALTAAVMVPVVAPGFSNDLFGHPVGKGNGDGDGDELTFNDPMVSLAESLRRNEPVDLLTVTGDIQPQYLRLAALDLPQEERWTSRPLSLSTTVPPSEALPRPIGMSADVATLPHTMSITVEDDFPSDSSWLPVPYLVQSVGVDEEAWGYVPSDQTVAAKYSTAIDGLPTYDVEYSTLDLPELALKTAAVAPPDIVEVYGDVPGGVPALVAETARAVTAGAVDDYERALLLQGFFRDHEEFSYDLTAGYGYGYQAMEKFLLERRGFCQHFAATMALMARILGIPSRVVVGFLQPDRSDGESYVFSSDRVHSWPELYFEGVGWVRFEPTQGVGAPFPQWAEKTSSTTTPTLPSPTEPSAGAGETLPKPSAEPSQPAGDSSGGGSGGGGIAVPTGWLVSLGALALLFLPAGLRSAVRRSRMNQPLDEAAAAESAWLELRDYIRDLRLPWTGSMTPRARQRSVAPLLAGDEEALGALTRLALAVERARYAPALLLETKPAADAKTVMSALARRADGAERLRALLWPASLLPDLRARWHRRPSPLSSRRGVAASGLPSGS